MSAELPRPDYARNMRLVGYSDQGGRPDGVQIMVQDGYAYIGHMFSNGFSVVNVRDPKESEAGELYPCPAGHMELAPSSARRSASRHQWEEPLPRPTPRGREGLLFRFDGGEDSLCLGNPGLQRGYPDLQYFRPTGIRVSYPSYQSKESAPIEFGMWEAGGLMPRRWSRASSTPSFSPSI